MDRWDQLHLAISWNGARTEVRAVYANGQKVESLSVIDRSTLLTYLNDLHSHGWEKFAHTPPYHSMLEIYYFERPLAGEEERTGTFRSLQSAISAH